ncbi:ABC transporter permease [Flammeovirga agarivorans]|uniref:ABC transporter permease n=1 Tax=Flammeovirga agarivorans TaxID=2726742 RepID=UPI001B3B1D2B|nr:FtsX-like permease family protein [Flammeovirga agarivorans]
METIHNILLSFRLAFRNIISSGLRTWLTIITLSLAFVMILFFNSLYMGWEYQGIKDQVNWEFAEGQLIHADYDKMDPFTIESGHGQYSENAHLTPVLIRQANIYPDGRMLPILLKGIASEQDVVKLPTKVLSNSKVPIPVIIGQGMAQDNHLKKGDEILMRWKDKNGTFDAQNVTIVDIFETTVPTVDANQVWIGLEKLNQLTGFHQQATYLLADKEYKHQNIEGWEYESKQELLQPFYDLIEMKKGGSSFLYGILMLIALIAIFDSQVFSVFKRQKEIGTYIALGFTKKRVTFLFTLEGTMYAFIATIVGSAVAIPLIMWLNKVGIPMTSNLEQSRKMGITIDEFIYPLLTPELFFKTIILVVLLSAVISYLPVRKISKMNTVDALKGKK